MLIYYIYNKLVQHRLTVIAQYITTSCIRSKYFWHFPSCSTSKKYSLKWLFVKQLDDKLQLSWFLSLFPCHSTNGEPDMSRKASREFEHWSIYCFENVESVTKEYGLGVLRHIHVGIIWWIFNYILCVLSEDSKSLINYP